ncbi:helix-turn-helix domain-containing protein [Escherichia coli]
MHNTNHNSSLINSLLLCAQAALLGGTVSNRDVINVLDIAQDLVLLTINDSTICSLSSTQDLSTPLYATSNWLVNLRTQREACGLTTAELARLLDLDEEIIIQWESGEYEPTISMLIPLANILGCDPLSLLNQKDGATAVRVNTPEVHVESIGDRIRIARKKLGLTEADLARMIHTYSDPVSDWECGTCEVPADQIIPLASVLNCDLIWLLTGKSVAKE